MMKNPNNTAGSSSGSKDIDAWEARLVRAFQHQLTGLVRMKCWEIDRSVECAIEKLPSGLVGNTSVVVGGGCGFIPLFSSSSSSLDAKIRSQITHVSQSIIIPSMVEYAAMSLQARNHIVDILDAIINSYKGNV